MAARESSSAAAWVGPALPCFAVVGKVNTGKSAVLATLLEEDDDRIIRISPEPGETTRCQRLSLTLDGVERLRFIDTPGFQEPVAALRAIRALHGDAHSTPGLDALAAFVDQYRGAGRFADECRLLEPLLEGAGIVYVVDPGLPVHDSFLAEIEILRFSGRARLALLNRRGDARAKYDDDWRMHLNKTFNLVRSFDAHQARFAARRDVLVALGQIDERDRDAVGHVVTLLDAEWRQRRELAAEHIRSFLRAGLELRERETYATDGPAPVAARRDAVQRASRRYFAAVARLERETADALLAIYRHTAVRAAAHVDLGGDLDLASDETWRRLGLTRQQLTVVGAAVGAGAGLGVDVAAVGHTLGLGALLGGLGGGALAFFKGEALPQLTLDFGRVGALGGRQITLGPPRNPNFAWVLLDSVLVRYRHILRRAHARRGEDELAPDAGDVPGIARTLAADRQKTLARWFRRVARGRDDGDADDVALHVLADTLADIEAAL